MSEGFDQPPLDLILPRRRARGRDGFLVSRSNADALRMIDRWKDWPEGRLALIGPEGAGKTHLAHVWMEETGAERVAAGHLREDDAPALAAFGAAVIEDVDRIAPEAEASLFHLMNLAKAEGATLLLTGRGAPKSWAVRTPDLASRLRALTAVSIEPPDDDLLSDLLAVHLANRQLKVGQEVIRFLVARLDRSAAAMAEAAERLDRAALAEKHAITRPFARKVLKV